MKQRVADYIAETLVKNGIRDCFLVTGGGAMYLNDALGHHPGMHCTYHHHEQACAMAAEAYARVDNDMAVVCVTTGPGATNAVTGVAGAWMDSIPMLVISGQARYATTVPASGLKLRTRGIQEFDIIGSVSNMTKYCELIQEPEAIRRCLEKALYLAKSGRPGPCWLDIPLDVQAAVIDPDKLPGYHVPPADDSVDQATVREIADRLRAARRPVIFAGNGIRLGGAHMAFLEMVSLLKVPVVTGMSSVDAIETDHPYYIGRNGTTGDRAGNFAIQNCDLLLSLGSRQSFFQTGFSYETWAKGAYKIINDIDPEELEKDSLRADMKVCCDVGDLILKITQQVKEAPLPEYPEWLERCLGWKQRYPVVCKKHYQDKEANIYAFFHEMTSVLPEGIDMVVSVGTSRVAGSQASVIHKGRRFYTNPSMAAMGYGLPASIGVSIARGCRPTVLVTGDGSLQMNIQELQTIVHNRLPIMIFVMNNQGYHSIRMTQESYFEGPKIGIGEESGDLSFPDLSKLIPAYGMPFYRINHNAEMHQVLETVLQETWPCVCEVMLSTKQVTEPKAAGRRLPDGRIQSSSLEDMAPYLPREELEEVMGRNISLWAPADSAGPERRGYDPHSDGQQYHY